MEKFYWFKMGKDSGPAFKIEVPEAVEVDELAERAKNAVENWKDKKAGKISDEKFFELLIMRYVVDWKQITNKDWNKLINMKDDIQMIWGTEKDGSKTRDTEVKFKKEFLQFLSQNASSEFIEFYAHCQTAIKDIKEDQRLRELDDLKN